MEEVINQMKIMSLLKITFKQTKIQFYQSILKRGKKSLFESSVSYKVS